VSDALPSWLWLVVAAVATGLSAWTALPSPPRLLSTPHAGVAAPTAQPLGDPETAGPRFGRATLRAAAAAGAGTAALVLVPGVAGLPVAGAAVALVWWRSRRWETAADQRRREQLARELPHVVDLMVAALESGASPEASLHRVAHAVGGPLAEELRVWLAHLGLGSDPALVWAGMARDPELGRLGRTLHRAAESGAPVSMALARLAEELRARARADVEVRVRQVEVRAAVPLAVCLLPAFLLLGVVPLVAGSVGGLVIAP
jgi:Flp pilus assembly protein TadB